MEEFIPESWHKWIAIGVTVGVFAALQLRRRVPLDLLFLGGLIVVTLTGVIRPHEAVEGFSARAVLTIAAFLVIAAGLRSSGVLDWIGNMLLGPAKTETSGIFRLALSLVSSSGFLLNTALVAMMAPVVVDWCRKCQISPSRVMIPLSYFTILGGVCTLIGTSTTVIVNSELTDEHQKRKSEYEQLQLAAKSGSAGSPTSKELEAKKKRLDQVRPMSLFEIGKAGLPIAIVGSLYLVLIGRRMLPFRTDMLQQLGDQRREYLLEMLVTPECRLIGQTVEAAGLRNLPGLFLIEIDREGEIITPVSPSNQLHANDRLVFTGVVESIVDLEKIPGLIPVADLAYEIDPKQKSNRHLTEVVLSPSSPLINQTVKESDFRSRYNAAVVAVHRNGKRLPNKVGDIVLEIGDTLLLQTTSRFVSKFRNSREFFLVSEVTGSTPRQHHKTKLAALLFFILIVWLVIGSFGNPATSSFAAPEIAAISIAVAMVLTGCLRMSVARNAVDVSLFITIASALGIGRALQASSGAELSGAELIANATTNSVAFLFQGTPSLYPWLLLIVIYLLAMFLTEMITNNAVAILMFPIATSLAEISELSPRPFVMAIALAASLAFMTPIGYQTNLMVMGPGGYRPIDYLKCGAPLSFLCTLTAIILIPQIWPF